MTSSREEGGHERRDATWSVRPADERAGFSSVMLAGSPLAVPYRHLSPCWAIATREWSIFGSTRNISAWD